MRARGGGVNAVAVALDVDGPSALVSRATEQAGDVWVVRIERDPEDDAASPVDLDGLALLEPPLVEDDARHFAVRLVDHGVVLVGRHSHLTGVNLSD